MLNIATIIKQLPDSSCKTVLISWFYLNTIQCTKLELTMNYKKIYDTIIKQSKNRIIDGYVEKHHIIPKCMNGTDNIENLAILTAREHFVCHQLLVKMYPNHYGLVNAATMMCVGHGSKRITNRLYEWLKIKHALAMSKHQMGSNNSNFGKVWYNNTVTSKCLGPDEIHSYIQNGWIKGRTLGRTSCKTCSKAIQIPHRYCDLHKADAKLVSAQTAAIKVSEDDIVAVLQSAISINSALKTLGITNWARVSKIAKKYNIMFKRK